MSYLGDAHLLPPEDAETEECRECLGLECVCDGCGFPWGIGGPYCDCPSDEIASKACDNCDGTGESIKDTSDPRF